MCVASLSVLAITLGQTSTGDLSVLYAVRPANRFSLNYAGKMRGDLVNEKVTPQSSPPLSGKLANSGEG